MRCSVRWLSIVPALVLASSVAAQRPGNEPAPPVITVSAQGRLQVVPDRAYVVLSVETRQASAAQAASENANKQAAVISALRSLGISRSQISTQNYSVSPETRNDEGTRAPRIVSYLVSNSVRVEISDLSILGKVIDTSLSRGANQVSSVSLFESNADALYEKALTAAVSNARRQAETMAAAAGGKLGPLLELSSEGGRPPVPALGYGRMASIAAATTPIMPGQDTVEASVSGRWVFIQTR
jgi:uncharacterized protein